MKTTFRYIAAAAMLAAMGAAQAARVPVANGDSYNGLTFSGTSLFSFATDALRPLDTAKLSVVAYGNATATTVKDTDDYWERLSFAAPTTSLAIDPTTNAMSAISSTGGLTLATTRSVVVNVTNGGSLTVTDLSVDLVNKLVYGTISGAHGLGTKTEALWNIGSVTGSGVVSGAGTYTTKVSDLTLTDAGLNDFSTALGFDEVGRLGKPMLAEVTSYGSITTTIIATTAVPEPSTYALMGLGLAGMSLAARRRKSASI